MQRFSAEISWGLGRTEFEAGNLDVAIEHFTRLVNDHPQTVRSAQAHFLLGEIYSLQGKFTEAATEYGSYVSERSGILDSVRAGT